MNAGDAGTMDLPVALPLVPGKAPRHLGYIKNFSFHIWYHVVERFVRLRAAQYGIPRCTVMDAQLHLHIQLEALNALIANGIDALIVTPVAETGTDEIVTRARNAHVPTVIEANPLPGMSTLVAICDYDAGWKSGRWTGQHLLSQKMSRAIVLDIAYPLLRPCLLRSEGFLDGLRSVLPDTILRERVNGEARVERARQLTQEVLIRHPDVNVIFGMDDESIQGAVQGVQALGAEVQRTVLVGFGLAGDKDKEMLLSRGPLKASLAMFPEWVGVRCVDQAVRLFNNRPVSVHDVAPTLPVTPETLDTYYRKTGDRWAPDFSGIDALPRESECRKV